MRRLLTGAASAWAIAWRAGPILVAGHAALTLIEAVVPVAAAWLTKLTLDAITSQPAGHLRLATVGGSLALCGVVAFMLPLVANYQREELNRRIGLVAQDRLFAATERFTGLARFEDPEFLNRLSLAQGSGGTTPGLVVAGVLAMGRGVVTVVGFLGSLLMISPWLGGAAILAAVPTLTAELKLSRQRAAMLWRITPVERREIFYRRLLTSVQAAKELRLFGTTGYFRALMTDQRRRANLEHRRMDRRELATQAALGLLSAGIAGAGLVWVITAAARGDATVGDVSLLIASVAGVLSAVAGLVSDISTAHGQLLLFEHFLGATSASPDLPQPVAARRTPALRRGLEFRDVWFRYSAGRPWVLRDLSFAIPHGRSLALVGHNGSGKSTIVKLLCRFYDPNRGAIYWDGLDLRAMDPADLRKRIGALFQDYMEYDLSAADNIGLGDLAHIHDKERIRVTARRAGIHDTLAHLPNGYDTLLSRLFTADDGSEQEADTAAGTVLSGGQWQRVALARGLLRHDRDLLILDEPSAGLDADAEHEINNLLREHRTGRTSVLVTHRLGTVRDSDLILVLDKGQVAEYGSHTELMDKAGAYARMFALQAGGYHPANPTSLATR